MGLNPPDPESGTFMTNTSDLNNQNDELISFMAKDLVFQKDEPGSAMYLVIEGEVDILIHGKVLETVGPGGVIGEMALLDMGPRSATATAKTDCLLLTIDRERFQQQVRKSPGFSLQVMRIMAERLRRLDKYI